MRDYAWLGAFEIVKVAALACDEAALLFKGNKAKTIKTQGYKLQKKGCILRLYNQRRRAVKMDPDAVAKAFVEHYYSTFDTNRSNLANLYQESSMLTFEGQKIQGSANIVAKRHFRSNSASTASLQ
ncbi:hypothetical protein E3N88_31097 [Mikania micrantha]|uniref:NTF2 domain-containing protein n=1 Tax=Mikania micrantha TaxID=192012 RepID=A0A5N6MNY3_9ASTR|nr:hypothetical protein E3N88_31097 [Mikania micrantha]